MRRIASQLHVGYGTVRRDAAETAAETPAAATAFAIALFERYDRPAVMQRTVGLDELAAMLTVHGTLAAKKLARCWSPTLYADGMTSRSNAGVAQVSALVFDLDRVPPDPKRLGAVCWIAHTTWSHTSLAPRWRVTVPLAQPVTVSSWGDVWRRARAALCPEADPSRRDASRQYYVPSRPAGVAPAGYHPGPLLDPRALPELPVGRAARLRKIVVGDDRRSQAYMHKVIDNLATAAPGRRNAALNGAAWTLGRWVAAGVLEQADVEDALFAAAERNGLVADDGQCQTWATIRSGLSKGLLEPNDLER